MKMEPEIPKVSIMEQLTQWTGRFAKKNRGKFNSASGDSGSAAKLLPPGFSPTQSQAKRDDMQHFHSTKLTEKKQNEAES